MPTKKETVEEVKIEKEVLDIEIDINELTLDDLEILSLAESGEDVAPHLLVQFLKRLVKNHDAGKFKLVELQEVFQGVTTAINEAINPKDASGKN